MLRTGFRFGLVGLVASAVHLAVASFGVAVGLHVLAANSVGFLVALAASLSGHAAYSFRGRTSFRRGARRFAPAAVAGFLANNLALAALVAATGDSLAWLKIAIAIAVIPPVTFCYAYFFAYRD